MSINVKQHVNGSIHSKENLNGSIHIKESLVGNLGISTSGVTEQYAGEYTVIPKLDQQILKTKQKVMTDDLTVKGVPVYEVSNNQGGTTVYIAKE